MADPLVVKFDWNNKLRKWTLSDVANQEHPKKDLGAVSKSCKKLKGIKDLCHVVSFN